MFGFVYIWLTMYCFCFVVVGPKVTRIVRQPQNVTEKEGESADFTFGVENAAAGSTVTWYKNTEYVNKSDPRITYDERNRHTGQFTLRINPLIRSDKGYYVAAYAFGEISVSSKKAYLDIIEVPSEEYPICTTPKLFYDIMENVIVSCITENTSPQPLLQFIGIESDRKINNGSHIMIQMIFRAKPKLDGKRYSCKQSGRKLETTYCTLTLNISNVFNVAISSGKHIFTVGDTAKLLCVGNFTESASFHWYIPNKIKNQVKMELNKNWIEIHVTAEANGEKVTCTIEDGGLEGSASVFLKVVFPEVHSEQSQDESTSTIIQITWLLTIILIVLLFILGNLLIVILLLYRIHKYFDAYDDTVVLYRGRILE